MSFDPTAYLPDALLERIRERAPIHDRENTFPQQDLEELREAGYLKILVPSERGGAGLGLEQAAILQQRLATASPATALSINMHLVWTGVAKVFSDRGVPGLEFVQDGAANGDVFAFGISEGGNDLVLFDSDTQAVPDGNGGYAFTGTKIFTSLAPVWTTLGLHGLDTTSEDAPKLVFAFIDRTDAVTTKDDWDTLGMRATQSRTTKLDSAIAAPEHVVRRIDPGPNPDPIIFGIFSTFELLLASVYTGIARRALDLATLTVQKRTSKKTGQPYSQDPDIRWRIAEMSLSYDALPPQIAALARDVDEQNDHGARWFTLLSGTKHRAVMMAKRVVDEAILAAGGSSYFSSNELSRLYRDVLAGVFHPSDAESAHSTAASALLGPLES
ncbi:MAG TPA: acyl-CoA dehydrogenase [Microbacterium sp.]|uniref:acyl-CoA dehydrogenase family protein n=1 Tax=Microbacterium sp. TaxID=51671 RepID=UPI000EDCF420|nr:acyl-CoA dehydrogenase [Microbacterium sp.]